jgi:putative hydrolase of the HAD superfamily
VSEARPETRAIVFDGDDTLWRTEQLYDDARGRARRVVEEAGNDGARWEELERRLDVENVEQYGHSLERFPTSCVQAYEVVCREHGRPADPAVSAAVDAAARAVFEREAPLLPHARETLAELRARGFRLALLTKGDSRLQRRRIEQSGLAPFFDLVEVVDQKTPEAIRSVLDRLGVDANFVLSVGNSIRSDVVPSLDAGVRPVWIDAHVWEYERELDALDDDRVLQVDDLSRLLEVAVP